MEMGMEVEMGMEMAIESVMAIQAFCSRRRRWPTSATFDERRAKDISVSTDAIVQCWASSRVYGLLVRLDSDTESPSPPIETTGFHKDTNMEVSVNLFAMETAMMMDISSPMQIWPLEQHGVELKYCLCQVPMTHTHTHTATVMVMVMVMACGYGNGDGDGAYTCTHGFHERLCTMFGELNQSSLSGDRDRCGVANGATMGMGMGMGTRMGIV